MSASDSTRLVARPNSFGAQIMLRSASIVLCLGLLAASAWFVNWIISGEITAWVAVGTAISLFSMVIGLTLCVNKLISGSTVEELRASWKGWSAASVGLAVLCLVLAGVALAALSAANSS